MPDVTLCKGGSCGLRATCRRYTAKPDEKRQSYFAEIPATLDSDSGWECEYYDGTVVDEEDDGTFPLF